MKQGVTESLLVMLCGAKLNSFPLFMYPQGSLLINLVKLYLIYPFLHMFLLRLAGSKGLGILQIQMQDGGTRDVF